MAEAPIDRSQGGYIVGQRTFGSFLKKLRSMRGLSWHSLAIVSAIQERRLESLELNQTPPSYQHIRNLAVVLEVSEWDLLEAAGYLRPQQHV